MAERIDQITFDNRGENFIIDGVWIYDPDAEPLQTGNVTFNVSNGSPKAWVDLIIESVYPDNGRIWQTGHIRRETDMSQQVELRDYRGQSIKITRWAPGVFGIPGNGGGEVFFQLPYFGNVTINLTIRS
ncbi:MAG: hypothetical protein ACKVZH_26825 [Blastocatellia bacterium]